MVEPLFFFIWMLIHELETISPSDELTAGGGITKINSRVEGTRYVIYNRRKSIISKVRVCMYTYYCFEETNTEIVLRAREN